MYEVLLLMHVDGHVENIKRDTDPAKLGGLSFAIPPDFKRCTSEAIAASPSPRMYGTHLPHQLLPPQVWTKKPKVGALYSVLWNIIHSIVSFTLCDICHSWREYKSSSYISSYILMKKCKDDTILLLLSPI